MHRGSRRSQRIYIFIQRSVSNSTYSAFTLLKVLPCQPQRHAPRDLLMELLWPEYTPHMEGARLEYRHGNRNSGNSYRLAPYPLIWIDAGAFEWYVAQACRLERFGDDPLPLWEEAYRLASRGAFLADELYSDWVKGRRAVLAGHYRQCVHEVTRLYRQRGARAEAERVLREHLVRELLDEDGLRPFMELLGEQERYQEALEVYQRTQEALAQEERTPDPRTQDIAEYLRTRQITRARAATVLSTSSGEESY
jgi:DNA-binding SARP family transcriptional activator